MRELQRHEQVSRRDDDDLPLVGILQDGRVGAQRRSVAAFVGQEHQHVADTALDETVIVLHRELIHMAAHRCNVLPKQGFPLLLVVAPRSLEIGCERHFRVNHYSLTVREVDHSVRTEDVPLPVAISFLQRVLLALDETAVLKRLVQYHFAPVSLCL